MATKKSDKDTSSLGFANGEFLSFGGFEEEEEAYTSKPTLNSLPLLKLMQNQSPEALDRKLRNILPGNIIINKENIVPGDIDEDGFNTIDGYVLEFHRLRRKFQAKEQGNGTDCSCPTMYVKGEMGTRYGKCAECCYNHEGHFKDPGACQAQFNITIATKKDGKWEKYHILCSKSSYGKAADLVKMLTLARKHFKEVTGGKAIPYYAFKVRVGSLHITGNYDFYLFDFKLIRKDGSLIPYDRKNDQGYGATTEFNVTQEDANELLTLYNEVRELRAAELERHEEIISGGRNSQPVPEVPQEATDNINSLLADSEVPETDIDGELPF